jgi:predicted phage terminase large subunit-like protein
VRADETTAALLRRHREVVEQRGRLQYQAARPHWARKVLEGGPGSYAAFVRWAWHILEPGTLLRWNWHMDVVCDAIQRQIEGDPTYRRLLLVLPPGTGKSITLAGCRDPYMWLAQPYRRTIYLSANDGNATRDSRRARNIIQSPEYQELMRAAAEKHGMEPWKLAHDQNETTNFENSQRGFRQCLGMGSDVTGKRGDDLVIDDPMDAKEALLGTPETIERRMKEASDIIGSVLTSRVNDQETASITIMMQRLYPSDPAGMAIAAGGWKVIVLPMEYDPDLPDACGGPCVEDRRRVRGESLHPGKFPEHVIARLKQPPINGLGLVQFEGQYNAKPSQKSSKLYDAAWFANTYHQAPAVMRREMDRVALVCDASFKKTGTSNVALEVWGKRQGRLYLLHEVCRKMGYRETRAEIRRLVGAWSVDEVVVEDKANGSALVDDLGNSHEDEHEPPLGVPVVPFNPGTTSKVEREELYSVPAFAAGNVLLPEPQHAPWVGDYVAEHLGGTMNDRRDTTSMAIAWLRRGERARESSVLDLFAHSHNDGLIVGS